MESAWLYDGGEWSAIDNPFPDMAQETLREFGYASSPTAIFGTGGDTPGFTVELYPTREARRRLPYSYLLLVPALTSQPIFALDLPSVLQLLGQLAPLIQAATA
ncbi:MAG TPA: hypothetical protein VMU89_04070 [Thermomicrobiaceae bacterium]|nr:hypothetical protein [Thermomicrobiaceae bacterium]